MITIYTIEPNIPTSLKLSLKIPKYIKLTHLNEILNTNIRISKYL